MKPLLRAVLVVDALLLLGFGVLFLLTPWTSMYGALQLVQTEPAMVGQAFGVVLLGLAWLALRASVHGAMTTPVARTVGHVNWVVGVLMLVWLLGLHKPSLTGFGQLVSVLAAVILLLIGLGGVRLAGAVRRRERVLAAEAIETERVARQNTRAEAKAEVRAEKRAARDAAVTGTPVYAPVEPVMTPGVPVSPVEPELSATPRPVSPLSPRSPDSALAREEAREQSREEARREARDAAADPPRPPFHG